MKRIRMVDSSQRTVAEEADLFLQKCRARNLSEKTLLDYQDKLRPFIQYSGSTIVGDVSGSVVDGYVIWFKETHNVSDISLASYLRPLRAFLYWCMDTGRITRFQVRIPKADKQIKEVYTDDDLDILLKKPDIKTCSFTEYKVWVFENYLLGTGNRLTTALNIRIKDLDFGSGFIVLTKTKNRRQQIIPMSESLSRILREYLSYRGGKPDEYLFCTDFGGKATTSGYQTLVRRYNYKRGVRRSSIHAFRHTFAKHWIIAGGDVFRLQKILGHSDISVTREYVEMFGADLQKDFDRFNPLDARAGVNRKIIMKSGGLQSV